MTRLGGLLQMDYNKNALDISVKATAFVDEDIYKKLLRIYDK